MKTFSKSVLCVILCFWAFLSACNKDPAGPDISKSYDWEESTPDEQRLDSGILSTAFEEAGQRPFIRSILIVKNGYLVAEQYFRGFDRNDAHNVKSVSKSFLSALVGIALREQHLDSLGEKMLDFFPEYVTPDLDPRKHNITIRDLLMMRAGIDHERNNYMQIYSSANWIKATIELPLLYEPGERFSYNTFQTHLLSAILTKATDMSTLEFARRYLLSPLHISIKEWERGPKGYYFGGNSMFFTPRNMARFGYLYLKGGLLDGEQIVPADWVAACLANYTGNRDWTWGELKNVNYGYLWWLGEINGYPVQLAIGYGGQFIILIPALDMIIVTTCNSELGWDEADEQERSVLELVANHILLAIKD